MSCLWILLAVLSVARTSSTLDPAGLRCECNGNSASCVFDGSALRCVDCHGNTEGRHCERCKNGFYQQGAEKSCTACRCNIAGSVSSRCDSRGRCSCKEGVTGEKCDRCPDGPIRADGCMKRRQVREDSGSLCFCYGHSSRCSGQSGYSVHNITSTFTPGPEGWWAATEQATAPRDIHFRWSPKYQDLEVISKTSLPIYLYAPGSFLRNQVLSYGQNFSFSLRLDRGVRYPSSSDVILEGSGLRVTASLGNLLSVVPCGKKINYSFRLDEQPGSPWRPQLSRLQFQTLLQNLTAIKIRATFGENGRGYLDNVQLVSARRGPGVPALWVQGCSCPPGLDGEMCERCSAGFKRTVPADGAFSPCEPCSCAGGTCDPQTGDCFSADETSGDLACPTGFYRNPWLFSICMRCPCAEGVPCSLTGGALVPTCHEKQCPPGTTGARCDVCEEGFYGDPLGGAGVQRPCRPCQCNGHIDLSVTGSCDHSTGECLKCVNNTRGWHCDACLPGFYHSQPGHACKACGCDPQGSHSEQCDDGARCRCRPGFEGLRCQRSKCPACFTPIKSKMEAYAAKIQKLEALMSGVDGGLKPTGAAEIEAVLRATKDLVTNLEDSTEDLAELEKSLQRRLSTISRDQQTTDQEIGDLANEADDIKWQQQTYRTKVKNVETLIEEMKLKLKDAESKLQSVELPLGDAPLDSDVLSALVPKAASLADKHQNTAKTVERSANEALSDSKKSQGLVRTLLNKENKVKELIGGLKTTYDQISSRVKGLEREAVRLSDEAKDESKMANNMLKEVNNMEKALPPPLNEEMASMVARLDNLNQDLDNINIKALQDEVSWNIQLSDILMNKHKTEQQAYDKLVGRVDAAKAMTEDALGRLDTNTQALDDVFNTLQGFDKQVDDSKALADAAIKRLPGISSTIQQAVKDNADTQSIFRDVSEDYSDALKSIGLLDDLANSLEDTLTSLPSPVGLEPEATKLNLDMKNLQTQAAGTSRELSTDLEKAIRQEAEASKAAVGASAAYENAKQTRDGVGHTLQHISNLLANIGQSNTVDMNQLLELEKSLNATTSNINQQLKPRLKNALEQEEAYRRRLADINMDIDTIQKDISNLEEILETIPDGCFSTTAIEKA
ncbi:laminin subunit gamma-1 [Thalassophryne amazonica]|uniref:laminin subunit gamma-1 n=1 Tax=Thalassophryne amazonica TaxID=390379 RepID=UPI0014714C5C|nr:laminin subunit gamma-1 [Thalassophryne amazonica]